MPESPRTTAPTRLSLETLEAREVPALGLDTSFGAGGLVIDPVGSVRFGHVAASAAAPGDKSVVVGNLVGSLPYGTGGDLAIARLTAGGAADPQFGGGDGLATFSFDLHHQPAAVSVLADGKVLVAGVASPLQGSAWDVFVLRLNADGSRDTSFGTNGETVLDFGGTDSLARMVVQPDGKIVLAGRADGLPVLERLNANGTPDASFGTAGVVRGAAESGYWTTSGLAVQPDGKVVVSGTVSPAFSLTGPTGNTELTVRRFNANGTPDASFGTAGRASTNYDEFLYAYASDLALLGDGRLVVGGGSSYGQGLLAWFDPNGALISQEQFSVLDGNLGFVHKVVAMPLGGVEVIGSAGGETRIEYHAAPGSATDARVVAARGGDAASLGANGKLLLPTLIRSSSYPMTSDYGGSLGALRLADPGATESPITFVQLAGPTEVPAGTVTLSAYVDALLGADPVTGGTLTFREGTTVLGTLPVVAPPTDPWAPRPGLDVNLSAGVRTITAEYSGTARWSPSRATATFYVGQTVAVSAALAVSDANPALGETVVLSATLTRSDGGLPVPNAVVTFYDGETVLGTAGTMLNGVATLSTAALTSGTHSIRAVYRGDTGFDPAESAPVRVDVSRAYTELALSVAAPAPVVGQMTALTATVRTPTSTGVTPRGSVTFYDGSTVLGTSSLSSTGVAAFTTSLRLGARTLRAVYSGDATTFGSTAPPVFVTVGRAPTRTGITASAASVAVGQPVTLTATVQPVSGTAFPVGAVEFREGTRVLGTAALDGRGQAKLTLTGLTAGGHVITAVYVGSSTCLGSTSGAYSVTVAGPTAPVVPVATTTTLTTSAPTPVFGQSQTLTARVTGGTVPPGGRVEFYDGATLLGSAVLNARGEASLSVTLNLGAHKLRAVYLGEPAFTTSSSALLTETVTKAPTTVALTTGAGGTVRAQVRTSFAGSPIGTVTFKAGNVVLGTAQVDGNGVATFRPAGLLAPGSYRVTAVYGGSSCFLGTTSDPFDITV